MWQRISSKWFSGKFWLQNLTKCAIVNKDTVLQGGSLPNFQKAEFSAVPFGIIPSWEIRKREVVQMDTYQILTLLFLGGNFLIALLAYLDDRNNKRK